MFKRCVLLFAALFALDARGAYSAKITLDKPDGFYKSGETATCTVQLLKDGEPLVGEKVFYLIRWENQNVRRGTFVTDGKPDVEKMELITFDPVHHTYIQLGKTVGKAFADGAQLK